MLKKIIIVDDDAELAEEMAEILRDEGFIVENTSDTLHAEKLISSHSYDLYLLDYKMSHLSGVDLLKKIKFKDPESKVFIISGRPAIEKLLEEEKVNELVSAVFKKPFDIETLLQRIKSLE
ncbi:MAG: response regulator [Candidatus Omnitrophica bacterium]|nr:response regulator [Candidatus Omnitrophota bacterium]MDD5652945.1 response regulator [Candidatus Omnitrophota bacterium]